LRKFLKWTGIVLGSVVGVVLVAFAVLFVVGGRKWNARHERAVEAIPIATDAASIARGEHLAQVRCTFCHGDDLGGKMFVDDGAFARIAAPNLTAGDGGRAATYTDVDWVRTLRHGLDPNGRELFVMPAEVYYFLDDEDLGALVAYLRQAPKVDRRFEPIKPGPLGRVLRAVGQLDPAFPHGTMDHTAPRPPKPPAGATPEYGEYLARTFGCMVCHGPELTGGGAPGEPELYVPNLTPGGPLKAWNEELFLKNIAQRESEEMPWRALRKMTDEEQRALWRYLASQPARASVPPAS
jgi:mono/diheme cytochrome c family protein